MHRNEKEIRNPGDIEAVIRRAKVCRLGLCDRGSPYVVPVCFGFEPGVIWIHSAREGKKITMITANSRVCFEIDEVSGVVTAEAPCSWGMQYRSVIGSGIAEIVRNPEEKIHGLSCIMDQYSERRSFTVPVAALEDVCVIRIRITEMTGKQSQA